MGLERLLVELGPFALAVVKAVGADRAEVPRRRLLLVDQPAQGLAGPVPAALGLPPDRPLAIRAWGSLALS